MCGEPVATPAVTCLIRQVKGYTHSHKVADFRSRSFPLLPDAHANPMIEPLVDFLNAILHTGNAVVIEPSSGVSGQFLQCRFDALDVPSGRKASQGVFKLLP